MRTYTFTSKSERSGTTTTTTFTAVTWPEVLLEVRTFLAGCGFYLPEGELDFVNEFEDVPFTVEDRNDVSSETTE